jgi:hypothetical protein
MFCSFAYVKRIPQFLIQLKYKLKGKNRFSGFTGLESDGFSVLILSKTAQAYAGVMLQGSSFLTTAHEEEFPSTRFL